MTQASTLKIDSSGVGSLTIAKSELLDARRVLTFAAGINEVDPAYLDDSAGECLVHPGIAFSLQYNAQGRLGIVTGSADAWLGAVHAETDLRIHQPFSVGDMITTQGQVVARRQLPSGVYNLERYRMIGAGGQLLAELDFGLIFRGVQLTGGERHLETAPPKPELISETEPVLLREMFVSRNMLHHYTGCTGIFAAIHTEKRLAVAAGFPDIILHGSATKSIALSAVVAQNFDGDPARVTRFCGQLRGIIPADTNIRIEQLGTTEDESQRHIFFRVLNASGEAAVANGIVSGWRDGARR